MTTPDPMKVDGIDYTKEGIEDLREEIIEMRDEALRQNAFDVTVKLTHVIALLSYLSEVVG